MLSITLGIVCKLLSRHRRAVGQPRRDEAVAALHKILLLIPQSGMLDFFSPAQLPRMPSQTSKHRNRDSDGEQYRSLYPPVHKGGRLVGKHP